MGDILPVLKPYLSLSLSHTEHDADFLSTGGSWALILAEYKFQLSELSRVNATTFAFACPITRRSRVGGLFIIDPSGVG